MPKWERPDKKTREERLDNWLIDNYPAKTFKFRFQREKLDYLECITNMSNEAFDNLIGELKINFPRWF